MTRLIFISKFQFPSFHTYMIMQTRIKRTCSGARLWQTLLSLCSLGIHGPGAVTFRGYGAGPSAWLTRVSWGGGLPVDNSTYSRWWAVNTQLTGFLFWLLPSCSVAQGSLLPLRRRTVLALVSELHVSLHSLQSWVSPQSSAGLSPLQTDGVH